MRRLLRRIDAEGAITHHRQVPAAKAVLHQAEEHAHRGRAEAEVPRRLGGHSPPREHLLERGLLREPAADDRPQHAAGVDAGVVEGVSGIATHIIRRVQVSHQRRDVSLEHSGAQHHQHEAEIEGPHARQREADVPRHDQDATPEDRAAEPDQPVRHPAARQGQQVDHRRVGAVDRAGIGGRHRHAAGGDRGGHEEDQERAHAVVAEALPHLREEERGQAARMAEERPVRQSVDSRIFRVRGGLSPACPACA